MSDILEEIVAHKRIEVGRAKLLKPASMLYKQVENYIENGVHKVISLSNRLR